MAKIKGTGKNDKLKGKAFNDKILGLAGDDKLKGKDGNDKLVGGTGNDVLDGGRGRDTYKGGAGDDLMLARDDSVDDKFVGGAGIDTVSYAKSKMGAEINLALDQGNGAAQFDTYDGIENIEGTQSGDHIVGDAGDNVLRGLGGNDFLEGGAGNDILDGGDGDDLLLAGPGANFYVGGAGVDTVSYEHSASGIDVELLTMTSTFGGLQSAFSGIEDIEGSQFNDRIEGNGAANHFYGFGGKDTLKGGNGNDILDGGEGDDVLEGGAGADQFVGGNGFDTVTYIHEKSAVNVYLWGAANTGAALGDAFSGIEQISGSIYNDVIQGNDLANRLYGNAGGDVISGRGGKDVIDGGDGADLLDGGAGDDLIYAADETALSADIIVGGAGKDTISYFGANGSVNVDLTTNSSAGRAQGDSYTSVVNVIGTYYSDTLRPATGGMAFGDRGDDLIRDSTGTEILRGGRGADTLYDSVFLGDDGLRDIFVLENYGDGTWDIIGGFNSGGANNDQFWLAKSMFKELSANAQGILNTGYFINSGANHNATAAHAQLIYQGNTHQIWYDKDGTGSGAAVQIATLTVATGMAPGALNNLDFKLLDI